MIKRTVIGVLGFVLVAAFSFPAFADQSIGYRQYFKEGVKAFREHDDQKALRCFKIAQIYDRKDAAVKEYLEILTQRGIVLDIRLSKPPEDSIGYKYYLSGGIRAFQLHDNDKAVRYFKIAKIFWPGSKEAQGYLDTLAQPEELPAVTPPEAVTPVAVAPAPVTAAPVAIEPQVQPQITVQAKPVIESAPVVVEKPVQHSNLPLVSQHGAPVIPQAIPEDQSQPYSSVEQVQQAPAPIAPKDIVYVGTAKPKSPPVVLSLSQITNNNQLKPRLQIELNSSVILEGKNIQKFLVINEGFIGVKIVDPDHIEIGAVRIGSTFLHIWDDSGRHTLFIEVVFPKSLTASSSQEDSGVRHSQPFVVNYTNDWDTYYSGKNIPAMKRQNYELNQTLAMTGETPYGFFDTSGSYTDFESFSQFDTYTIGLSQIPVGGTTNFNLRGFDALRYLSPLTMPSTILRGVFADVDLMDDLIGLSVSHGQEQVPQGFISVVGEPQFNNSYIDAAKLTLFPKSTTDQYSLNFATGYGSDRPAYLSDHVYSVEGHHKINDYLTLNGEEGSDSSHSASLASLKWDNGTTFKSGLNFRNIDKDYATVSTLPAYQGETGAVWTTDGEFKKFTEDTFIEAYRDRIDANPDNSSAYNYDGNGQLRMNINEHTWSDTNFNFIDTPGEFSPTSSIGFNERLSRSFGIWNHLKGIVFSGAGYQNSHSPNSNITNYDREDVIAGIQLPLTTHISAYANDEYDWLNQASSGGNSNPNVINAGIEYEKQFNPKFSFTSQVDYHDEMGVKPNSFLSGEESVILTTGLNYTPTSDMNIFADVNASRVLSHIDNPAYDDFEVHLGVRLTFGGATYWDPLGTVSGIVFKDRNGSGKFEPGDVGVPGVKLKVGDKQVTTDRYGRYKVKIRARGVQVIPILDTVPQGLLFSTPQSLNVEIVQGRTSRADFGLLVQTGIYGLVFVDKNGSGMPTEGDSFVGKVKVILDGTIIEKSDSHGAFYFRKVSPGDHVISIDINTLPLNMLPLIKLKNKIDVAEGTNYMFNIPVQIKQAEGDQS